MHADINKSVLDSEENENQKSPEIEKTPLARQISSSSNSMEEDEESTDLEILGLVTKGSENKNPIRLQQSKASSSRNSIVKREEPTDIEI
jgi:hypothetical protein